MQKGQLERGGMPVKRIRKNFENKEREWSSKRCFCGQSALKEGKDPGGRG
jgi:hypothetical protein